MDKLLILDFGGQTTQLIGRRVRDLGVYTEIYPADTEITEDLLQGTRGLILSGSPFSVNDQVPPWPHASVFECGVPVLGICFGTQILMKHFGGEILLFPPGSTGGRPFVSAVRKHQSSNK